VKLSKQVKVGDILLPKADTPFRKLLAKFQHGDVHHACIVYDNETVFETDTQYAKSRFTPIEEYEKRQLYIVRAHYLEGWACRNEIKERCRKYEGKPYSYWDILTNMIFSPFARNIRSNVIGFLGTKYCMICSELVARIWFEVSFNKIWRHYEGMTPMDIKEIAMLNPADHIVYYYDGLSKQDSQESK
jgi:hypothetical protein